MVERLAEVAYWFCVIAAAAFAFFGVVLAINTPERAGLILLYFCAMGAVSFGVGWATRYILVGK